MKWYSNIKKYAEKSREKYIFSVLVAFVETGKVFKRVSKDKYLQFKSILSRISTVKHTHRKNNVKILGRSICRCFTNITDLVKVGDGGGGTYRHIFEHKVKNIRINLFIRDLS